MKFPKGLNDKIFDFESDFGRLSYVSLRTTSLQADENGEMTEVKKRVYNLLSDNKRAVVQVSIPADVPEKDFRRGQEVVLVNPVMNVMAVSNFPGVDVIDYLTADDIISKGGKALQPDKKSV